MKKYEQPAINVVNLFDVSDVLNASPDDMLGYDNDMSDISWIL